jgi:pimeloyl-ACP methyl ester carboxylesterase
MAGIREDTVRLRDGRALAYTDVGDSHGAPVFYFHGNPGSRLDWAEQDCAEAFAEVGVRFVSADRPGFGRSDPKRGRGHADWPSDVVELADQLGIDRFAVLGYSRGGPYALACAALIPDRISAVGTLSGVGPHDMPGGLIRSLSTRQHRLAVRLAVRAPALDRRMTSALRRRGLRDPEAIVRVSRPMLTAASDRDLMRDYGPRLAGFFLEATRQGAYEFGEETRTWLQPPGFRLEDVRLHVALWHGEEDSLIPISHCRELAKRLASAELVALRGVGHLHPPDRVAEIAAALATRAETGQPQPS